VRITRQDTQLAGDKAEVDFASGESRLINTGSGRVRALLPSQSAGASSTGPQKTNSVGPALGKESLDKGAAQ